MLAAAVRDAFPSALKSDALAVAGHLTSATHPVSPDGFTVLVDGESVTISQRVYFDEVTLRAAFSPQQLSILDCLLTRHHDGFVRERALRRVINLNTSWSAPFVVQLVSEYIIEILDLIEASWAQVDGLVLGRFLAENPRFHALVRQRVASYWDVYYRGRFPSRESYVGFGLLRRLEEMAALVAGPAVNRP